MLILLALLQIQPIPYVPTRQDTLATMLQLAHLTSADAIYEPGCGDARVSIAAVRSGARSAICVDISDVRVQDSLAKVARAGLSDRIQVRLGDALTAIDAIAKSTVVLLYMGDEFNAKIRPLLQRCLPDGARVVSNQFSMRDWLPTETALVAHESPAQRVVYLWVIRRSMPAICTPLPTDPTVKDIYTGKN